MNDSSVNFFNIVNKLGVKSARKNYVNGEIDYVFMNDRLDSSRYVTGLFRNLYTDHSALFVRVSTDTNNVFHLGNSEDINGNDEDMEILGVPDDILFPQGIPNIEHEHTEDSDSSDNVIEIDTSYGNIPSIEIVDTSIPPLLFRFDNNRYENNCWLNCDLQVLLHMLQYVPNDDYQYGNARIEAFMTYLKDTTNRSNSEILCVTDANISIPGEIRRVSVKDLFTKLIRREEWNSSAQQDSSPLTVQRALGLLQE